jgi:hypothetical protein
VVVIVGAVAGPMAYAGRRAQRDLLRDRPRDERRRIVSGQVLFLAAALVGALILLAIIGRL